MNRKILALAPIIAASSIIRQNKKLKVRKTTLKFNKLPQAFDNFKIAQVSDVHCDRIGYSDLSFIKKIKNFNPDIIVITGDILDSYNNDMDIAYNILSQLAIVAPCYFVSGNHELRLPEEYEQLKNRMKKLNITYLHNSKLFISKNNESINLVGVEDYNFFNILLSHRPEKFPIYADIRYELIFSGHAHGGQWRIPFVGGIFSPSQGFFPKYTNGNYVLEDSTLIVSQGLGNSSFPIRINNRIELVLATLKK